MFLQPRLKDRKILLNALGHFDGFHVGASSPASEINFVQDVGKPFFVDPMAYMFSLAPEHVISKDTGKVRASLLALAKRYSPILESAVGKRAVTAKEILAASGSLEEFTHNVLEYQRTKFHTDDLVLFSQYYDKYDALDSAEEHVDHATQATAPCLLIPPFFFNEGPGDAWYRATLLCARMAIEHKKSDEQLYPTLFLAKELLIDSTAIDAIANDFSDTGFDGIILWINGMSEESASPEILAGLIRLVNALSAKGKPVVKLFGGFLSILMHQYGISAFSCNLSYRTSRDVLAYKWIAPAPPKARFYIPALHQAYELEEAFGVLTAFPSLACNCGLCRSAYGGNLDRFVSEMRKEGYCQNHFLNARKHELELVAKHGPAAALDSIDGTLRALKKKTAKGARHLMKWRELFAAAADVGAGPELLQRLRSSSSSSFLPRA